ncbi:hypothetical protein [Lentilactobacillus parafarraginis]|uniref:hypothetical protein n=1 Tax=Lentilactobacillus parafarraginis TaxID=390842 RepID=UPI000AE82616|nr:hypothetical protein [Lentilactobacillus parafarraginis]
MLYQQDPQIVEQMELGVVDDKFKQLTSQISDDQIYQMINELNDISNSLRFTAHPDVYLQVLTVKITHLDQTAASPAVSSEKAAQTERVEDKKIDRLTNKINDLQREIAELKKTGVTAATGEPVEPATPKPAAKAANAHIELTKIYPILGSATRKSLNEFQQVWPDLMNTLSVTQRAVMHVSKPVAASPDGIIVAFEYPIFYQKARRTGNSVTHWKTTWIGWLVSHQRLFLCQVINGRQFAAITWLITRLS